MRKKQLPSDILIGCHVSNKGEEMLLGSVKEALSYNANCFMVYLGPPQNTMRKSSELLKGEEMKEVLKENDIPIERIIVHAPYIMNLAQPNSEKREFAIEVLLKEMKTMASIGFKYIVIHPGAHMHLDVHDGLELIADSLKKVLSLTAFDDTMILLETMAGKGSECCKSFEEIKELLNLLDNNERIGVCLDTCHIHDGGYDIINHYDDVITQFDSIIGLDKIKALHINDSKNECGAHKDRHENFGFGKIGFKTLMKFVTDERFKDIPKILETPYVSGEKEDYPPYAYEISMIRNMKFDSNLINKIIEDNKKIENNKK